MNIKFKFLSKFMGVTALAVFMTFTSACGKSEKDEEASAALAVDSRKPTDAATNIPLNIKISATFNQQPNEATINATTFTLSQDNGATISGTFAIAGEAAIFTPAALLLASTTYTAILSKDVASHAGNQLPNAVVWSFTTGTTTAEGLSPIELGAAGEYIILAKTSVSTTGTTSIVGNVGLSPAAQSYLTGFSETLDASNNFATAAIVTGTIQAADMAVPTPANLTAAVSAMETAYSDAAGRTLPDFTELGAGNISGSTLVPGLYKWGTGLLLTTDVTISGTADDVWIFQIAQDLTVENGVAVVLAGGAQPQNIFWQVAGQTSLGTTSAFKGIILSQTTIVLQTGARLDGKAMAQTAVTLDASIVR